MAALEALWQAYAKRDVATANKVYHDDLSYGHSTGSTQTKDEVVKQLHSMEWLKLKSSTVRVSGPVAVVRAVMDLRSGSDPSTVRNVTDINVLYVLLKGPEGWQVIVRQAVKGPKTKDPRQPPA